MARPLRWPAKANSGLSSARANQVGVLRGFVSAYSQKDVAGTMQRLVTISISAEALAAIAATMPDGREADRRLG